MHRLTLLCHGATSATRRAAFPADEPVEDEALALIPPLPSLLRRADRAVTSPLLRARQTAAALQLDADAVPALTDLDHGRWAGRAIADIAVAEPKALADFIRGDTCAPHGGEGLTELRQRVCGWLEARRGTSGHTLAVTHAAVIRTAVLLVLDAPPSAFWRIDIEPLSLTDLRFDGRRWTVRSLNQGLAARCV